MALDGRDLHLNLSKRAPVPFPCEARRNTTSLAIIRTLANPFTYRFRRGSGLQAFPPRGRFDPLFCPFPIHPPAMPTCPVKSPVWVIVAILVERYLPHRVLPAKHVTAVSAMMPSLEESEGCLAYRRVTNKGVGIWFPVLARGRAGDFGKTSGGYGWL